MPKVDWVGLPLGIFMNDRMRTVGATCVIRPALRVATIQLNTQLFATLTADQQGAIIAHELAHALAFFLGYVREHHGHRWQWIAKALGDSGERLHTHDVQHNLVRRRIYAHKTNGKLYALSLQKSKNISFNVRMVLEFVGEVEVDRNTHTYRWSRLIVNELRDSKIFTGQYKLVA